MELGDTRKRKQPNIMVALAPLITVIVLLVCCQLFLNIEIHFPLLLGTIVGAPRNRHPAPLALALVIALVLDFRRDCNSHCILWVESVIT